MNSKRKFLLLALFTWVAVAGFICSNDDDCDNCQFKDGLVSTGWLDSNLVMKDLLVIDVRSADAYSKGHIEKSINLPFIVPVSVWTALKGDLLVELPVDTSLFRALGQNGIKKNSMVVLVTNLPTEGDPYSLASPTRVAITLAHAGLEAVAILDGGYDKWVKEERRVTTKATVTSASSFDGNVKTNMFADINYVKGNMGKITIVDGRDADVYSGAKIEPFANKAGHIPGAISLPAPSFWSTDGTYKPNDQIRTIVKAAIGEDINKEVIIYCGVGGYASTVWFVLTKILDYKNIKVYDGSAQEWVIDNDMVTNALM